MLAAQVSGRGRSMRMRNGQMLATPLKTLQSGCLVRQHNSTGAAYFTSTYQEGILCTTQERFDGSALHFMHDVFNIQVCVSS
jgi:hypothetical protein